MEIKLKDLTLENFKGIKRFYFKPGGQNATIRGNNATGKTTVADAFRWLLFGKDTQGKADFQLKTVDIDGNAISNVDHTVNGVIEIDGTPIELKKTYKEKWTKKRGSASKALTSHTTDHYIDDVPVQMKKWDSRLHDFIDEEAFKLVTLPSYFNDLHWQKRREILLNVCGNVEEADVLEAAFPSVSQKTEYGILATIINQRSIDDHRKVVKAEQKQINDGLKEIPARIDELHKTLPEASNRNAIESYINNINDKIQKAQDDSVLSGYRKALADAQAYLAELQTADIKKNQEVNQKANAKLDLIHGEIRALTSSKVRINPDIELIDYTIGKNSEIMDGLRTKYNEIAAQEQQYDEICPTCNQPLPEDQIEAAKAVFRGNKAEELARINDRGKQLKEENENHSKERALKKAAIKEKETEIETLEASLPAIKEGLSEAQQNEKIPDLLEEIIRIEAEIKENPTTDTTALENDRSEEQKKLAALDVAEATKARMKELGQEEKDLSAKYEELEKQIFLMEKFIVAKVSMLEEKINSKFELARFKLFETQINEGIKECCVTTVQGVPYGAGLNKGMEINVGLDIIKTLSEHYGIQAPVWIDNAEAVTELLDIPSQTFKLIVSKDHPEMEVT